MSHEGESREDRKVERVHSAPLTGSTRGGEAAGRGPIQRHEADGPHRLLPKSTRADLQKHAHTRAGQKGN